MSVVNHVQRVPNSRQYADAVVSWMRDGFAEVNGLRIEAGKTRKPIIDISSGNLVIRFHNTDFVIRQGSCELTSDSILFDAPAVQRAIADMEINVGDKITLRCSGVFIPRVDWAGDHVHIDWPKSTVHCDMQGVPKFAEPNLLAVRIFPDGTGDCVFSNRFQSVRFVFEG